MIKELHIKFENFVMRFLEAEGYQVRRPHADRANQFPDFIARSPDGSRVLVEVKLYTSQRIPLVYLKNTIQQIKAIQLNHNATGGIIVVSARVHAAAKESLSGTPFTVWDFDYIANKLEKHPNLADEFLTIIREAQAFRSHAWEYRNRIFEKNISDIKVFERGKIEALPEKPVTTGAELCKKINKIPPGNKEFAQFEEACEEALKYLFGEHLTAWKKQSTTHSKLHRFDLIARVSSDSDFWNALVTDYRARYIVFEFKNHQEPITQNSIYGTEKYLYPPAMRAASIIISREGLDDNARLATYGALRESGKLILVLSTHDLCKMLNQRDNGDDPSDFMTEMLDDMMMRIER